MTQDFLELMDEGILLLTETELPEADKTELMQLMEMNLQPETILTFLRSRIIDFDQKMLRFKEGMQLIAGS